MVSQLEKLVKDLKREGFQERIVIAGFNKDVFQVDESLDKTVESGRPVLRPLLHDLVKRGYAVILHKNQGSEKAIRVRAEAETPDLYLDPESSLATNKDNYVSPLTLARIIELVDNYTVVISS